MEFIINCKIIKLIIMDLDGTLYSSSSYMEHYYDFAVKALEDCFGYSENEAKKTLLDNNVYPKATSENGSVTQLVLSLGMGLQAWTNYRDTNFHIKIEEEKIVDKKVLYDITRSFPVFLLTNNTLSEVSALLSQMNISKKIFKKIITADSGEYKGDKLEGIKLISKISGIALKNILSVGDKYWVDIEPFIKIGGNGFLVKNPEDIKDLWERLKGMKQYEKSNHNT